jgi:hypothetical protein
MMPKNTEFCSVHSFSLSAASPIQELPQDQSPSTPQGYAA